MKIRKVEKIMAPVYLGQPAILQVDGLIIRTSDVQHTIASQDGGFVIITKNTKYIV